MADAGVETAARLLRRLRAGDRLDELARDYGTSVSAIRRAFAVIGIDRKQFELLRSPTRTPTLRLPDDLIALVSKRRRPTGGPPAKRVQWSDQQILGYLDVASTMAFPLSASEYDKLREERQVDGPSSMTIAKRFGSWVKACELADVECGTAPRDSYSRAWTNRELVSFVGEYLSTTSAPSFTGYAQWATRTEGAPSAGTVRNRLGGWWQVTALARRSGYGG